MCKRGDGKRRSRKFKLVFFKAGTFLDKFLNLLEIATFTVKAED
jgi:hypothetical protein